MKNLYRTAFAVMTILLSGIRIAAAQEKVAGIAEFDKTVHDFGDVMISDGPLSCTFNVKNISAKPMLIHSVVTSCGCTGVKWTREPVMPGESGSISAVYTNDEGPYPFDKSLTVYISGIGKPVILRIRGISHEKQLSLEEMYPVRFGSLGMKSTRLKCGNLEQGESRSDETVVANLSSSEINVSFADVSPFLSVKVVPNPVPARSTAKMQFTVTSDRSIWGKNMYYATPVVNGREYISEENGKKSGSGKLEIYAFTKENFASMTAEERDKASRPMFDSSSFTFGKIKAGTPVDAVFTFKNIGKSDFKVFKADVDAASYSIGSIPVVKCGFEGSFTVHVDTTGMPAGETLVTVTLTTNSPSRPIVNLFITGYIE
ncbi:MAG: DUF1573 domain-containing protein [Bacteroidetes bacterium]|uniref:DUF1573 domain-containing protein n=1 Tax=Candidatus Cryptobacteroides excrementipullorum TaxID=2840761 RepID=A0A9D9NLT9_9BACT|nr:DUF1573 domain-containing protein [Candidatus Cryptobacteroides excrementipullorum]